MAGEMLLEYVSTLEKERKYFDKYVLINTGKTPHEGFNVKLLPCESENLAKYGFIIKLINLITGLDTTNELLIQAYETWKSICSSDNNQDKYSEVSVYNTYFYGKANHLNKYIVYDMKYFIDEIIAITWCLTQTGKVNNVKISSIGEYLKLKDLHVFDSYIEYFRLINNIANAYKHSIPNDTVNTLGRDELCVFALYSKYNNDIETPEFIGVTMKDLVSTFNDFYKYSFEVIKDKSKNQN